MWDPVKGKKERPKAEQERGDRETCWNVICSKHKGKIPPTFFPKYSNGHQLLLWRITHSFLHFSRNSIKEELALQLYPPQPQSLARSRIKDKSSSDLTKPNGSNIVEKSSASKGYTARDKGVHEQLHQLGKPDAHAFQSRILYVLTLEIRAGLGSTVVSHHKMGKGYIGKTVYSLSTWEMEQKD